MKTNAKEVRAAIREHVLDCVTDPEGDRYNSFGAASDRLKSEFNRVANYPFNLKRLPNDQERFSDYLCGLPFSFHFTYYDIQNYLNGLGINPKNKEFTGERSMCLYHYLIYREIV